MTIYGLSCIINIMRMLFKMGKDQRFVCKQLLLTSIQLPAMDKKITGFGSLRMRVCGVFLFVHSVFFFPFFCVFGCF